MLTQAPPLSHAGVLVWDVTYFNDWPSDKYEQGIRNQNRRNMTEPQLLELLDSDAVQNREVPIDWTPGEQLRWHTT